jgi:hypothetical protein
MWNFTLQLLWKKRRINENIYVALCFVGEGLFKRGQESIA